MTQIMRINADFKKINPVETPKLGVSTKMPLHIEKSVTIRAIRVHLCTIQSMPE